MALPHATSGQLIDILPLGPRMEETHSNALFKTSQLELMRLVLPRGKGLPEHTVPGAVTIQCIEGEIELQAHGKSQTMQPGQLVYLAGGEPHSLHAFQDASVLLTLLFPSQPQQDVTRN